MFKYLLIVTTAVSFSFAGYAKDITIASDKKSDFQIVINTKLKPILSGIMTKNANRLQKYIKEVSGVEIPIVEECSKTQGKPCIYIGNTEAALSVGIPFDKLDAWEYIIKTTQNDIYIAGNDRPMLKNSAYFEGTSKGIVSFLEDYAGVRFVLPGETGIFIPEKKTLSIPAMLDIRRKPSFLYCGGKNQGGMYDLALNYYIYLFYGTYGGHSHDVAIAPKIYGKTNPEYFALIDGARKVSTEKPQYCLSNPSVRELIYKEVLRKLDEGFEWVQLNQSDSFKKCQCDNCKTIFGQTEPGEQLWIMHRQMAEKLKTDRPGKKVVLMSYGPTVKLPQTFKEFPDNVVIEMANYSEESFNKWRSYKVPGGFTVYLYNWGYYQLEGLTPKRNPAFIQRQIKLFKENNIRGIFRCGYGELPGLEGPAYYIYGKLLANPDTDTDILLNDFCVSAYGNGSVHMKQFFDLLHKRLDLHISKLNPGQEVDWNDPMAEENMPNRNIQLLSLRYPDEIIASLEQKLNSAENACADDSASCERLRAVRVEFDYLKYTAGVANIYSSYKKKADRDLLKQLCSLIDKRNNYIDSLNEDKLGIISSGDIRMSRISRQILKNGGRSMGALGIPYNWNTRQVLASGKLPGASFIEAVPIQAQSAIERIEEINKKSSPQNLEHYLAGTLTGNYPVTLQCGYDKDNLYIYLSCHNISLSKLPPKNRFYIFMDTEKQKNTRFNFRLAPGAPLQHAMISHATGKNENKMTQYDADKLCKDITVSTVEMPEKQTVTCEFKLPLKILDIEIKPETALGLNIFLMGYHNNMIWDLNTNTRSGNYAAETRGDLKFGK